MLQAISAVGYSSYIFPQLAISVFSSIAHSADLASCILIDKGSREGKGIEDNDLGKVIVNEV